MVIRQLEENLPTRDAKRPYFQFNVTHKSGSLVGTVGPVSLAGGNGEELLDAKEGSIGNFFEGVWDAADIGLGSEESADVQCMKSSETFQPQPFRQLQS